MADDSKIVSFPMKTDGTPDFGGMTVDPPPSQWNVPATWKVKGCGDAGGSVGGGWVGWRGVGVQVLQGGGGVAVAAR